MNIKDIETPSQQFEQAAAAFKGASEIMTEQMFNIRRDSAILARSLSAAFGSGIKVKSVNPPINTPT